MKDWLHFAAGLPFFLAGWAWEWVRDYFKRGQAYYEWLTRE